MGGLFSLTVIGGAVSLRENNPSIATLLGALVFCLGFTLIIITNTELATANMMVMTYTTLQRKTSVLNMCKVLGMSYLFNTAGCLFFAWFLAYWTNTLSTPAEQAFAIAQAEGRVQVKYYWSTNFLRAVGCNWLVCLGYFLATGAREYVSKIYAVSFPVWAFGALGYQHFIANFVSCSSLPSQYTVNYPNNTLSSSSLSACSTVPASASESSSTNLSSPSRSAISLAELVSAPYLCGSYTVATMPITTLRISLMTKRGT